MRAVVMTGYGGPEVLETREVAEPVLGPHDVLVQVVASSVNPVDTKVRQGVNRAVIRPVEPWILGLDVSGAVLQVGEAVTKFKAGDEVFSSPSHKRPGCYAERVAIHEDEVALKPPSWSHNDAASIPLVGLTAWQCLMPRLAEREGQRVFVQAGSGGVGTFAIQLAHHHGAWVASTCSERNHPLVRDLGCDRPIDYRSEAWDEVAGELDLVLDSLGGAEVHRAFRVCRPGARVTTITTRLPHFSKRYGTYLGVVPMVGELAGLFLGGWGRGMQFAPVVKQCDGAQLGEIAKLCEEGVFRPVIDEVFPMDDVAAAHAHVETGRTRGKVVLEGWC